MRVDFPTPSSPSRKTTGRGACELPEVAPIPQASLIRCTMATASRPRASEWSASTAACIDEWRDMSRGLLGRSAGAVNRACSVNQASQKA
eukprot:5199552-Heterocapsa_arctica.AAC.1